jgi:hypothetical protein
MDEWIIRTFVSSDAFGIAKVFSQTAVLEKGRLEEQCDYFIINYLNV